MGIDVSSGDLESIGSRAGESVGRASGDSEGQLRGMTRQVDEALRDVSREAKGLAAAATRTIHAGAADDFIRVAIHKRPCTTAVVALGIGFLIGRLAPR